MTLYYIAYIQLTFKCTLYESALVSACEMNWSEVSAAEKKLTTLLHSQAAEAPHRGGFTFSLVSVQLQPDSMNKRSL